MTPTPRGFEVTEVPFPSGQVLIEASAGTGKTFNLALSVVRLLLDGDGDAPRVPALGRILVVTFTNAATDELVNRIRRVLRLAVDVYAGVPVDERDGAVGFLRRLGAGRQWAEARLRAALSAVDTLSVFTIHGFARRVLDEFALESGTPFGTTLLEREDEVIDGALHDWWRRTFHGDVGLARHAVASRLVPAMLRSHYRLWTNWPDAHLAPDDSLERVRDVIHQAVRRFAAAWDRGAFEARALAVKWNAKAPCATAEQIAAIDDLVQRAAVASPADGDILGVIAPTLAALTADALHQAANKQGQRHKAAAEAIRDWPEVVPAQMVAEALAALDGALRADGLRFMRQAVAAEKARRQAVGFGDLLVRLHGVLQAQGPDGLLATTIRAQFDAALIDEFQDTDRWQFGIFTSIFRDRPLVLIGDPKQAIYSFRGADVQAYLDAAEQVGASHRYALQRNFRSTPDLVQAVNQFFGRRRQPFLHAGITYPPTQAAAAIEPSAPLPGGHALEVVWLDRPDASAPWCSTGEALAISADACVRGIVDLLSAGWTARQLAVLVRTGAEGRAIARRLRDAGVPAVLSGMADIFASAEMADLHVLLQAIAAPRQAEVVRAALASDLWGGSYDDVRTLLTPAGEAQWESLLNLLTGWRDRWLRDGVLATLQACLAERRVLERWLPLPDGDRRTTNLRHAVELVHEAATRQQLTIDGVLRWLATERATDHVEADATELRLETDAEAVQILTIHRSKGLEFDIVFCPTLWSARRTGTPPVVVQQAGAVILEHGSAEAATRAAAANAARLAEELRLLYVALTRARFRTVATWGPVMAGPAAAGGSSLTAHGSIHSAFGYLLLEDEAIDRLAAQSPSADATVADHAAAALLAAVDRWPAWLEALARASAGRIAITPASGTAGGARWQPPSSEPPPLAARRFPLDASRSAQFRSYALSSYTALTHSRQTVAAPDVGDDGDDDGRDVDAEVEATVGTTVGTTTATSAPVPVLPRDDFRAFPAGASAGTVLHTLFEHARFDEPRAALRDRAADVLTRHRLAADGTDPRIDGVAGMMDRVFATPFRIDAPSGPSVVTLRHVAHQRARHEWQFTLPLASPSRPLTARGLAEAVAAGETPHATAYAARVRQLAIRQVHGFLQGYIDLLFEQEGRWFIVDWKSNRLGAGPDATATPTLLALMDEQHFTLQAHLYLVAVHRFLRTRLPDYDYDRHVGGAAYAFLRGFATEAGDGWVTLRPSRRVIDALDTLIGSRA